VINGWASPKLLDSYEEERKAVGEVVAKTAAGIRSKIYPCPVNDALFYEKTEEGEKFRRGVTQKVLQHNLAEFDTAGIQFGLRYKSSAIFSDPVSDSVSDIPSIAFVEAIEPGCRLPHRWIGSISLFDELGSEFTLLKSTKLASFSSEHELTASFERRRLILKVVDVDVLVCENFPLILVRPDHYIAWKGGRLAFEADEVVQGLCGFGTKTK